MTTAALPRGSTIEWLMKEQATPGTVATGNFASTFIYDHGLEEAEPFEEDRLLGLARNNNRDQTAPADGLPNAAGPITFPVDLNHIGYVLKGVFGAPETAVDSGNYTHVFKSGLEAIPHWTMQNKLQNADFRQYDAVLMNTLGFEVSRAAGFQRCTVGTLFRKENKLTSSAGGTPAAALARASLAAAIGAVKIDTGSGFTLAGRLNSAGFNYDNKAKPQEYVNSKWVNGHDLDEPASANGALNTRYANATYYDLARAKSVFGLQLLWEIGANNSLTFEMPRVRMSPKGTPVAGPAGLDIAYDWRAEQSDSAPMLTVTLKNQIAAY